MLCKHESPGSHVLDTGPFLFYQKANKHGHFLQTKCTFVWAVLITAAQECKDNTPSFIYRRGWGCSIHLHIIIVIRKSNFPCLWALLLLLEVVKKWHSKWGVCQERESGIKEYTNRRQDMTENSGVALRKLILNYLCNCNSSTCWYITFLEEM